MTSIQEDQVWPKRFATFAEAAPDPRTLCRTRRKLSWRLKPRTLQEVAQVLEEAGRHGSMVYPVSRGCNWGYGSHLPARDGGIILDLSALDKISEMNRDTLSVRIEPGVTQEALAKFLREQAPDLVLNVTGAGPQTSVLGNALDRGIGYLGEKDRDVFGLEVMLADGSLHQPEPLNFNTARARPTGPDLDSLFFQSNFGVVLAARLRLRIRQEAEVAVVIEGSLAGVMNTLKKGYDQALLVLPTHIAEPGRSRRIGFGLLRSVLGREPTDGEVARIFPEKDSHTALAAIHGRHRVVAAALRELQDQADPGVQIRHVTAGKLLTAHKWLSTLGIRRAALRLKAIRPLLAFTWGEPSEAGLSSLDGPQGLNPDHAAEGAIYGNAVGPVSLEVAQKIRSIVRAGWTESAFTWQILSSGCLIAIYTLHFREREGGEAHFASAKIIHDLRAAGFPQYRLDVNTALAGRDPLQDRIKAALDPRSFAP